MIVRLVRQYTQIEIDVSLPRVQCSVKSLNSNEMLLFNIHEITYTVLSLIIWFVSWQIWNLVNLVLNNSPHTEFNSQNFPSYISN